MVPFTNVVMLVRDRPRLTEQALRTLYQHTDPQAFRLCLVDDGSKAETGHLITSYGRKYTNIEIVHFARPVGIVGFLRNVGIWTSERVFGRGEFLYLSDNDVCFQEHWLERITRCKEITKDEDGKGPAVLGGYRHPFHLPIKTLPSYDQNWHTFVEVTDAVAGYSHLMRWACWDLHGPFDQTAKGVCQSEDHAFCCKVKASGGYVGYIDPPVIHNCGITNSEGKPAIGAEHFPRVPDLIYE